MKFRRIQAIVCILLLLLLTGCAKKEQNHTPVLLTIGDSKIHKDEVMYYVYLKESEEAIQEEQYQNFFQTSYWDSENENGITNRQQAKEDIRSELVLHDICYHQALKAGWSLTKEERIAVVNRAAKLYQSFTRQQALVLGLTQKRLESIMEKIELATQYESDLRDSLVIDCADATSDILEENYKEYEVKYLYLPTISYDYGQNQKELSKESKKNVLKRMKQFLKQAKANGSLENLLTPADIDTGAEYEQISFLKGDEILGHAFEAAAKKLKNNEITDSVVEEEDGYYIIQMIQNDAKSAYQYAIDNRLLLVKEEAFQEAFDQIKKQYKISMQESEWDTITIGSMFADGTK